jgi:hypothetical protein
MNGIYFLVDFVQSRSTIREHVILFPRFRARRSSLIEHSSETIPRIEIYIKNTSSAKKKEYFSTEFQIIPN